MAANRFHFRLWRGDRMLFNAESSEFYVAFGKAFYEIPFDDDIRAYGTLIQSTGRADSRGNEMFAGDVVRFTLWWFDGNVAETQLTGTLVYSPELMSFQLKGVKNKEWEQHTGFVNDSEYLTPFSELTFDGADFEVIGNIHENPELLESK